MKNKIKATVQIILIFISSFLFWYLISGFVFNEFNIWKWDLFLRGVYVIVSFITFSKTLEELK